MDASHQTARAVKVGATVVLNLGLGPPILGGRLTVARRIRVFQRMLRECMHEGFKAEIIMPRHVYGDEPVIVVEGAFNNAARDSLLLWGSMIAAEQDCIAVYYPDEARGYLLGPNAAMWGDFNINFFRFFGDDNG